MKSETGTVRSDRIPLKEKGHTCSIDLQMLFLAALHLLGAFYQYNYRFLQKLLKLITKYTSALVGFG